MARTEIPLHPKFVNYMDFIINHPNYRGLPIKYKKDGSPVWVAFENSEIGKKRAQWAKTKAIEIGIKTRPGVNYADVMLEIHPTKKHICHVCGSEMSIYYHYPNVNLLRAIERKFNFDCFTVCDHIYDVWDYLKENGVKGTEIKKFFINKFDLDLSTDDKKSDIISVCEYKCRMGESKLLGPGAMSNFPDRFVGFHWNRCCRAKQDKGRSKENMTRYNKDRRAYEYWSDGNLRAADQFMNSMFFKDTSADHIGPISLGFIHDSHYIQPMLGGDNSAKRDRLLIDDVRTIISIEQRTSICAISWYSSKIWEFTKSIFIRGLYNHIPTTCRNILKQNIVNFMFILKTILDETDIHGQQFLIREFIEPKYNAYFFHDYTFDKYGNILSKSERNFTARSDEELNRFIRIAVDSVYEYAEKENRNISPYLTEDEQERLKYLCLLIAYANFSDCRELLEQLVDNIQNRLIKTMLVE